MQSILLIADMLMSRKNIFLRRKYLQEIFKLISAISRYVLKANNSFLFCERAMPLYIIWVKIHQLYSIYE